MTKNKTRVTNLIIYVIKMNKRRQDHTGLTKYDQNCMCWNHRSGPYLFSEQPARWRGKYQSNQYLETGGGPAATAAVAIARLGIDVDFIGRVGDDSCGNTLLNELQSWGSIRRSAGNTRTPVHPSPQFWSTSMANASS